MSGNIMNIVVAGLGGQGVLKASDIIADVAFRNGKDVKKAEIHGMSQRGGSVTSDVRYGDQVWSPMVSEGEADFLLVLEPTQTANNRRYLKKDGAVIGPELFFDAERGVEDIDDLDADEETPVDKRTLNIAILGAFSLHSSFTEEAWLEAIRANLPEKAHAQNEKVFAYGRSRAKSVK